MGGFVKSLQLDRLFALESLVREMIIESEVKGGSKIEAIPFQTFRSAAMMELSRRRYRRRLFNEFDIFSDPAWDILLELFVVNGADSRLCVTAIGLESGVATTTIIRWISIIEKYGLVRRSPDYSDKRRIWVHITNKGSAIMREYFSK